MVKVSITLPNNAQITFESEEPEVIQQVVGMALRDLPRELMRSASEVNEANQSNGVNGNAEHPAASEKGNGVVNGSSGERKARPVKKASQAKKSISEAEQAFVEFCHSVNPMGDMRRAVTAAEGAARFLGIASVDAAELGRLFDLAGWQLPHSFVQTLRNAARSKFRWLERVPGRSGYYTVTDLGRATALES